MHKPIALAVARMFVQRANSEVIPSSANAESLFASKRFSLRG